MTLEERLSLAHAIQEAHAYGTLYRKAIRKAFEQCGDRDDIETLRIVGEDVDECQRLLAELVQPGAVLPVVP